MTFFVKEKIALQGFNCFYIAGGTASVALNEEAAANRA
jgi:hypothetical protein